MKTYLSLVSINKSKYQMADIGVKWMVAALAESAWRRNIFCPWFSIIEMHSTFVFYAVSVATENIRLWNNHWIRFKGWVTYQFWYAIRHNDARALLYITFEHKSNSVIEILKLLESVKNDKLPGNGRLSKFLQKFYEIFRECRCFIGS